MLLRGVIAVGIALAPGFRGPSNETVTPVEVMTKKTPEAATATIELLRTRVIRNYPHATEGGVP